MKLNLAPINDSWAKKTFPNIYRLCKAFLIEQIECFNKVLAAQNIPSKHSRLALLRMEKKGIKNPHGPLLRLLSALHISDLDYEQIAQLSGRLFLLEQSLETLSGNQALKQFWELIKSPKSFTNLVAETDWAARLQTFSDNLTLHNKKAENSGKNYDIRWPNQGMTIHADVKFYDAWFTKQHGQDILEAYLWLSQDEIKNPITISTTGEIIKEDQAIEEVARIHDIYKAAMNGGDVAECDIQKSDSKIIAYNQGQAARFIRHIIIYTDSHPRLCVSVVEVGYTHEREVNAIRRNLSEAAKQVPDQASVDDIRVVLIGSFDPIDVYTVKAELFKKNGLFKDQSFSNIEGVIFFSFSFQASPPDSLLVCRTCEIIERPGLSSRKKRALQAFKDAYQPTYIPLKRRNP